MSTTQPIFIFSCARTGSTLLRYILDTHPSIFAPPELNLGQLGMSLYLLHASLRGKTPTLADTGFEGDPEVLAMVRDSIAQVLEEHTKARGKSIWCEKSPPNLAHLNLLANLFPEARYICLHRHCLDAMRSCRELWHRLPPVAEYVVRSPDGEVNAIASYWVDGTTKLLELERQRPSSCHRVRYEDLVLRTDETLDRLFGFLGLEWSRDLLAAVFQVPHDPGLGDPRVHFAAKVRADRLGVGSALPSGLVGDQLYQKLEQLNEQLGYPPRLAGPVPGPLADGSPGGPESAAHQDDAAGETVAAGPAAGPRWVFDTHLPARLRARPELLGVLNGSYGFAVGGEQGGHWLLAVGEGAYGIQAGASAGDDERAVTFSLEGSDLVGIVQSRVDIMEVMMAGRVRVTGRQPAPAEIECLVSLLRSDAG